MTTEVEELFDKLYKDKINLEDFCIQLQSKSTEEWKRLCCKSFAHPSVVQLFRSKSRKDELLDEAFCSTVVFLNENKTNLVDVENRKLLGSCGVLELVVDILNFWGCKSESVAASCCFACFTLSRYSHNNTILSQEGICEIVVRVLNFWGSKSERVALGVSRAILNLSCDTTNDFDIAIQFTSLFKTYVEDSLLISTYSQAVIANLCIKDERCQDFINSGIVPICALGLQKFGPKNKDAAEFGCRAVHSLACRHDSIRKQFISLRTGKAILECLTVHGTICRDTAAAAYGALQTLTCMNEFFQMTEFEIESSCKAVLNSIITFGIDEEDIALVGMTVLTDFLGHVEFYHELTQRNNVFVQIQMLLKKWADSDNNNYFSCLKGLRLLWILSYGETHPRPGVSKLILHLITKYRYDVLAISVVCGTIIALSNVYRDELNALNASSFLQTISYQIELKNIAVKKLHGPKTSINNDDALLIALSTEDWDLSQFLLKYNKGVFTLNSSLQNTLQVATNNGAPLSIIKQLFEKGMFDIDYRDSSGSTVLHIAVQKNVEDDILYFLCEQNANVNSEKRFQKPVNLLVRSELATCSAMKILLEFGAIADRGTRDLARLQGKHSLLHQMEKALAMSILVSVRLVPRLGRRSKCFIRYLSPELIKEIAVMLFY